MENKFELVEKYNIDVDVFIEENGVTPVGKLPDNHLTKEFFAYILLDRLQRSGRDGFLNVGCKLLNLQTYIRREPLYYRTRIIKSSQNNKKNTH